MKKIFLLALLFLGSAGVVHADVCATSLGLAFTPAQQTAICSWLGKGTLNNIVFPAGKGEVLPPYTVTMAATPNATANPIKPGFNIIPTVAANSAGCLDPFPTPGTSYIYYNQGGNSVRIKACGTPGINGGAAGTYIVAATGQTGSCRAISGANYYCSSPATLPTPSGP